MKLSVRNKVREPSCWEYERIMIYALAFSVDMGNLSRYAFSMLTRGKRYVFSLKNLFEAWLIEDWISEKKIKRTEEGLECKHEWIIL